MRCRIFITCFLLLLVQRSVFSQNSDLGIWYEINGEYSLNKKIDLTATGMLRTFSNGTKLEQAFLEFGTSYSFNKYLSVAAAYRLTNFLENNYEYHIRHKWFADIKGSYSINKFAFSTRFRFEIQKRTYFEKESDKLPEYDGRIKFKVMYKIPKFPVNPYISVESFSPMFENSDVLIAKARYATGLEFKINKKNYIESDYIFQRVYSPHVSIMHIISLSYTFKF